MRSVLISVCVFPLLFAGCATVSMVPGSATIGSEVTEEQSALRTASKDYVELAEAEDWVQRSSLMGFAKILVDGVSGETASEKGYAGAIDAASAEPEQVLKRLSVDIGLAKTGLEDVTLHAQAFIQSASQDARGLRKDVMSYEKALIAAQKSRRSFAEALTVLAERTDQGISGIDTKLAGLDASIDTARKAADTLADLYAAMPSPSATS